VLTDFRDGREQWVLTAKGVKAHLNGKYERQVLNIIDITDLIIVVM